MLLNNRFDDGGFDDRNIARELLKHAASLKVEIHRKDGGQCYLYFELSGAIGRLCDDPEIDDSAELTTDAGTAMLEELLREFKGGAE